EWQDPAFRPWLRHGVIHLPILVAHRGRRCPREVEEKVACRLLRFALEIVALIDAVEGRLDDARILAGLNLLLQVVALWTAGDVNKRRDPVERGEQLVLDRARFDVARPANDQGGTIAAFPGLSLLTLERRDAAVREGDRLGAVVGGEDDNGIVELAHGLELLEHVTNVVVHLLHADLVGAPVLATTLTQHGLVLSATTRSRRACARGCTRRRT